MALTQVPIELSSTPGIVDNSNTTAITIDSSQQVGIGTSSPATLSHISSGYVAPTGGVDSNIKSLISNASSGANYVGLGLLSGNNGGSFIHFGDTDDMDVGVIAYFHDNNRMQFSTNGAERLRISSAGNVELKGGQELRVYRGDNATYGSIKYLTGSGGLQLNDKNGDGISFVQADGATQYGKFDAGGNLLVGGTNSRPAEFSHPKGISFRGDIGQIQASTDGNIPIVINRDSSDGDLIYMLSEGSVVGSIGSYSGVVSYLVLDPRANGAGLIGLSNEIAPANESGNPSDAAKNLGSSSRRFKDLYLSGGVVFGSTGGSVTSKTLDDYEEGTWTPTASAVTTAPTITYDSRGGGYTKVGNMVTAWCYIYSSSISGASGYPLITGLPFPIDTTDISYAGAAMGITTGVTGSFDSYIVGSYVRLWGASYASSGYITFTLTYPTAS